MDAYFLPFMRTDQHAYVYSQTRASDARNNNQTTALKKYFHPSHLQKGWRHQEKDLIEEKKVKVDEVLGEKEENHGATEYLE